MRPNGVETQTRAQMVICYGIFILLYTQSQLKCIKNVNGRPEIVKILEDIQENFMTLVLAMMSWVLPQKHTQ